MHGYYRFPTIRGDTIVFVCEDDLWTVPEKGGIARRLTSNLSKVGGPSLSPDGELLAFTGSEEGPPEVYCMPAEGGEAQRLTYQGANAAVVGWKSDGSEILYSSDAGEPHWSWLWSVSPEGGSPIAIPTAPVNHVSFGPSGRVVIGRMTRDPATWKRYRGGMADGSGLMSRATANFNRLSRPMEISRPRCGSVNKSISFPTTRAIGKYLLLSAIW